MRWQTIKLQSLDMSQRLCSSKAGHAWNGGAGSEVEEDLRRAQLTRTTVVQSHIKLFWGHKTSAPHDQFGAACFVDPQVFRNLTLDHRTLALTNRCHVDNHGTDHRAIFRPLTCQMRDLRAGNLVLAGHAGDVGTGTSNPPPLHDRSPSP